MKRSPALWKRTWSLIVEDTLKEAFCTPLLSPIPILGLDVDNGGEFINEHLMRYCDAQQITFTRGRPDLKADQCYVEQKNGAIVRTMVGHDRLIGEQAYRQLREVYRAVRLFINCFQPSMKLQSKS